MHMCIFMGTWSVGGYGCYIGCVSVCVVCVWQYSASAWHVECMPGRWSWVCMVYIDVGTQTGLAFAFGLCVCLYMLMPALARGVTSWMVSQLPHPISLPSSLLGQVAPNRFFHARLGCENAPHAGFSEEKTNHLLPGSRLGISVSLQQGQAQP